MLTCLRNTLLETVFLLPAQVFSIEFQRLGERGHTSEELMDFMSKRGYKNRANVTKSYGTANDFLYVKEGYLEDIQLFNVYNNVIQWWSFMLYDFMKLC